MRKSGGMKYLLAALVLMSASMVAGIGVANASTPTDTMSPHRNTVILGLLDGLQDLIEQIDEFLEAVVDLLTTLQELFGGGESD
jgi:hypothetical protein